LKQGLTVRIIQDHKGAPITSLDSAYEEVTKTTYWLAASRDRRVSVWRSKWHEEKCELVDWLSFPAPKYQDESENSLKSHVWSKYPPSIAQLWPKTNPESIFYTGYGSKKQILVYNLVSKKVMRTLDITDWCECITLSPKGNLLALGTKNRILQLKDVNEGNFQDFPQHSDSVSSLCFSSDGKRLFSTSYNEIFIWDVNV
jgi:WD40 repeat protein